METNEFIWAGEELVSYVRLHINQIPRIRQSKITYVIKDKSFIRYWQLCQAWARQQNFFLGQKYSKKYTYISGEYS